MEICFNQATTMKHSSLEKDLVLCEKYGYDLIEIRIDKLKEYLNKYPLELLEDFFKSKNIKPYAFNALEFVTFRNNNDYSMILKDMEFLFSVGEKINCRKIVVVPTFDVGEYTRKEIKDESVRVLNDLGKRAKNYDFKLAFEFVGYPNCSVNTLFQAYKIVSEVNRDNVGLVLDCFHFHAMNSKLEDLEKVNADKIFIFHINDSMDIPPGALRDKHRVWPGDGVIDLKKILGTIRKAGYNKMASIELFNEDYWEWDIEKVIKTGKEKIEAIVAK